MSFQTITLEQLDNLKVDEHGNLYWKDGEVSIKKKISLRGYELFLATVGALGALAAGIHPFLVSFGWI